MHSFGTVLALIALWTATCGGKGTPEHSTTSTLRALAAGLNQLHATGSGYPAGLEEVCKPKAGCPDFPSGARLTDAWGRGIRYVRTNTYRLVSSGRDGRFGTPDDLTFSPEHEPTMRAAFIGCYELPATEWVYGGRIELDTLPVSPTAYGLKPAGDWMSARWFPLTDSTALIVRYDNPHSNTVIEIKRTPNGLVGRHVYADLPRFVAHRVQCLRTELNN